MSTLAVCRDNAENLKVTNDFKTIAETLLKAGVLFERWQASRQLNDGATQEEILDAYRTQVDTLKTRYGFKSADVISLTASHPDKEALRAKFLSEHTHSDFEVRFFVDGAGLFYIHAEDKVYVILCRKGDLISVPANTPHWFDMGTRPQLKCIRLFTTPEGWVADYTGSDIAKLFPTYDDFVATHG